jgi:hypothetical protein
LIGERGSIDGLTDPEPVDVWSSAGPRDTRGDLENLAFSVDPFGEGQTMRATRFVVSIVSVLALAGGLSLGASPVAAASGLTWNLSTDFRVSPYEANPNPDSHGNPDVWWFMEGTTPHHPSTYALLPGGFNSEVCDVPGVEAWVGQYGQPPPAPNLPYVGINSTGTVVRNPCGVSFNWPAGAMFTHPAPDQFSVIGWRSPVGGPICVALRVVDVDAGGGNGIIWSFDQGTRVIHSAIVANGGSASLSIALKVRPGQFLYSIVDANQGDFFYDTTRVGWVIYKGNPHVCSAKGL